mmetsp:Transcript_24095/g.35521  ORF Transcript_24095/g.35521 Transcript_24095/m.35521 type:complete len:173 (-) Transcript_24095:717-1235(-)
MVKEYLVDGSSLALHWKVMGTADRTQYSPIPVTKRFQLHNGTQNQVKMIARPEDVVGFETPHSIHLKDYVNNETCRGWRDTSRTFGNFSDRGNKNFARPEPQVAAVFHYRLKSQREFVWKSCVRLRWGTLLHPNSTCGLETWSGTDFEDTAWQILKTRIPRYAVFDDWPDYG